MSGESFFQSSATLEATIGRQIPGGCEDCDAFQTVERMHPGVYVLHVHHDATCWTLRRIVRERGGVQ